MTTRTKTPPQPMFDADAEAAHAEPDLSGVPIAEPAHLERLPDQSLTPLRLIEMALLKDIDADKLGKLFDLQERWEKNRAEQAFNSAMNACQMEMPLVVRDKANDQTKSRYASLDAVNPTCKPIYTKHGFSLSFGEEDSPVEKHKRTICDVLHVEGHSKRYHADLPIDGVGAKGNPIGQMNPVQAEISTGSYGQRVLLCRIFNITIGNTDKDGQSACITANQIKEINDTIDKILNAETVAEQKGKTFVKYEHARFLKWARVENLGDLPVTRFELAMVELKAKLKAVQS